MSVNANFNRPATTDNYATGYTPAIIANMKALAMMLDPAVVDATNLVVGMKRLNNGSFQQWNGTSWAAYAINVSGNAATADHAATADFATNVGLTEYGGGGSYPICWQNLGVMYYTLGITVNPASGSITAPGGFVGNASSATAAGFATKAGTVSQNGGGGNAMTFNWAGQAGQPTWVWGGNDGLNHYVYNPANWSVNYANTAGVAASVAYANVTGKPVVTVSNGGSPSGGNPGDLFLVW